MSYFFAVISHLRRNVPNIGKAAKKKEIIKNLEKYFAAIQVRIETLTNKNLGS